MTLAELTEAVRALTPEERNDLGNILIEGLGDASWKAWDALTTQLAAASRKLAHAENVNETYRLALEVPTQPLQICPDCNLEMTKVDDVTKTYECRGEVAEWKAPHWKCSVCGCEVTGEHDNDDGALAMENMFGRVIKKLEARRCTCPLVIHGRSCPLNPAYDVTPDVPEIG